MTATDDKWTDAPIDPGAYWHAEAARMRERPGCWRDVKQCDTHPKAKDTARSIRSGRIAAFRPAGDYDAVSRGTLVKAVYLGDTTTEEN